MFRAPFGCEGATVAEFAPRGADSAVGAEGKAHALNKTR